MDIARLPAAPYARPATPNVSPVHRVAGESVEAARATANGSGASRERSARVVQGELLGRQRDTYQSTRAFVNERNIDRSRDAGEPAISSYQARSALYQYANNIRTESIADQTRGRSVNFFV